VTKACILIKTIPTATEKILERIAKMSGVGKAYVAYGRWDIVAFIDAPTEEIGKISAKINLIDGVRSTETLPEA
jgi:DNA-binding Lrp family transcriptional regulator